MDLYNFKFEKNNLARIELLDKTGVDLSKADSVVVLKDGRFLFTMFNGFRYYVLNKNNTIDEVSEKWYTEQKIKNRMTKKLLKQNKAI